MAALNSLQSFGDDGMSVMPVASYDDCCTVCTWVFILGLPREISPDSSSSQPPNAGIISSTADSLLLTEDGGSCSGSCDASFTCRISAYITGYDTHLLRWRDLLVQGSL